MLLILIIFIFVIYLSFDMSFGGFFGRKINKFNTINFFYKNENEFIYLKNEVECLQNFQIKNEDFIFEIYVKKNDSITKIIDDGTKNGSYNNIIYLMKRYKIKEIIKDDKNIYFRTYNKKFISFYIVYLEDKNKFIYSGYDINKASKIKKNWYYVEL